MFLLKSGNHKLAKSIAVWNLPRKSCIGKSKECSKYCYGRKFEGMPSVQHSRNFRYDLSKRDEFESLITVEIEYRNLDKVRIHEVGDFYNNEYLDKWKHIAKKCPNTRFVAYTKSLPLKLWNDLPDNFTIFQSYGGKFDNLLDKSKNTARVIKSKDDKLDNEYLCPYGQSNFKKCGITCNFCYNDKTEIKHVVFELH